jgi:hypothetical protein
MDEFRNRLVEMLNACVERGMQVPFILCAASPNDNDSVLCLRIDDIAEPKVLAEHWSRKNSGCQLPAWSSTKPAKQSASPSMRNAWPSIERTHK